MGEQLAFKNGLNSDFQGLVTLTLTLHRLFGLYCIPSHTSLVDIYLRTKFHWNRRNFCGRTDVWIYLRTFGRANGHL